MDTEWASDSVWEPSCLPCNADTHLLSHGALVGIILWSTTDLKLTYLHYSILLWHSLSMNEGNSLACPRFCWCIVRVVQLCLLLKSSRRYLLKSLEPITAVQGSVLWMFFYKFVGSGLKMKWSVFNLIVFVSLFSDQITFRWILLGPQSRTGYLCKG